MHASLDVTSHLAGVQCSWLTLKQPQTAVLEVKKSKFLTTAWPITAVSQVTCIMLGRPQLSRLRRNVCAQDCQSNLQAEQYVAEYRDLSASHNCYAYKLNQEQRANDDGEPSSTAGQPILSAINAEQLNGVCVLVTR